MFDRGRGIAIAVGALCLALAGCSAYEAETTTVTTTVTSGEEATANQPPHGPYGTLGVRIFGPVQTGMSEKAVRKYFGEPDRIRDESLSPGPPAQTDWIWDVPGGTVTLKFDNSTGQLAQYATDSPRFDSAAGVSVGDSIRPVMHKYKDHLVESPLGTGALVLSQDEPGSSPALVFSLVYGGSRIVEISGGAVVQPAGE
jgi:hypothetical protein